ncbi:hypothetical protein [Nostoc sp. 2RC]|uniref:hypothetical protein n=1 Tax=Nostoc sp. 2RC TaxID=2485484 RepID=UPI001623214D|nr:hypothetical protein [Nostoc sp. 2RC]MBC1237265.1 hypothetical protein [Nostoc sp. 2RC]
MTSNINNNNNDEQSDRKLLQFELDLLKQEYFFLETTIEDYNKQIWVIKSLGLTATGTVITLMIQQQVNIPKNTDFLILAIPFLFWVLESQWKHFQRGFYYRIAVIESIFTENFDFQSPLIYSSWRHSFHRSAKPYHVNYWKDGVCNLSVSATYIIEIVLLTLLILVRHNFLTF